MQIGLQNVDTGDGVLHGIYVRGTNTVKRSDRVLFDQGNVNIWLDTGVDVGGTGIDSGTGNFIARSPNATVSGTVSYFADATHCELLATMQLMQ